MVHIGLIPDGNRRWCKSNYKTLKDVSSHWVTMLNTFMQNAKLLSSYTAFLDVDHISLYILSMDNMKREDITVDVVFQTFAHLLREPWFISFLQNINLNVIGKHDTLSPKYQNIIESLRYSSSMVPKKTTIHIAICYDPLTDAHNVTCGNDSSRTWKQPELDMVIRTGGEKRTSGFFPLHTAYAEWFFLDKMFPDLSIMDIHQCIIDLKESRKRRFGC